MLRSMFDESKERGCIAFSATIWTSSTTKLSGVSCIARLDRGWSPLVNSSRLLLTAYIWSVSKHCFCFLPIVKVDCRTLASISPKSSSNSKSIDSWPARESSSEISSVNPFSQKLAKSLQQQLLSMLGSPICFYKSTWQMHVMRHSSRSYQISDKKMP